MTDHPCHPPAPATQLPGHIRYEDGDYVIRRSAHCEEWMGFDEPGAPTADDLEAIAAHMRSLRALKPTAGCTNCGGIGYMSTGSYDAKCRVCRGSGKPTAGGEAGHG